MPPTGRLTAREWTFLGVTLLFWAGFVILLGKDTSWDFRNYHWYGPYALLNGRLATDVAVAHHGSWYNPYLDMPFYLLATHTRAWIALGVLGAVQGATVIPLYLIGRNVLRVVTSPGDARMLAGALALLGQFGALTITEFGTTYYDNVMACFALSGLAIIVCNREALRTGPLRNAALLSAAAGLITGMAMGLKLPSMPWCVGFAAALLAVGGSPKHIAVRLAAGGVAGVIGCAIFAAPWMLYVYEQTGNPLFPYFNGYWKSPLALEEHYRDLRFVPTIFWRQILFPFLFTLDRHVAGDLAVQDIRFLLAYILVIPAGVLLLVKKDAADSLVERRAAIILFCFAAAAYIAWLKFFAIYRYAILFEMLSVLLVTAAVGLLPLTRKTRLLALVGLAALALITTRSEFLERAPIEEPYVQAALPPIPRPDRTMVVMTGDAPLGFIVTTLPPRIPVLRIDGWFLQPRDGTRLTAQMKARVAAHLENGGDLYLLSDATDMTRARTALRDYRLAIRWPLCQQFDTNILGLYQWCPLARMP